jgi:hypothetical protein
MVEDGRIELPPKPCKGPVLPLSLIPHILAPEAGHDPATFGLTDRRYYQLSYSGIKLLIKLPLPLPLFLLP